MDFDHADIMRILPHRPPFLFIDRVIDVEPGKSGTGLKHITADEQLMAANNMALPGVLHLEIMAQSTAMICSAMAETDQEGVAVAAAGLGYLAGGDLDFIANQPGRAGETLAARVTIIKQWSQYILAEGTVLVGERQLSHGRFTIALADVDAP